MIYFSSDWHLKHEMLIARGHRPFATVEEMSNAIIANMNRFVGDEDQLWILGDVVMGQRIESLKLLEDLRCKDLHLILGNHDDPHVVRYGNDEARAERAQALYGQYFSSIAYAGVIDEFFLSHFPLTDDHTEKPRYMEYRLGKVPDDMILLHGHTHSKKVFTSDREFHVGVDAHAFQPVSIDTIRYLCEQRAALP